MDLYAENILDHFRNPHGKGELDHPDIEYEADNPACGDRITMQLQIDKGTVKKIRWHGEGCAISQAAMSMFSEEIQGKSLEELERYAAKTIYDLLGVPVGPRRTKCALLCLHALKNALHSIKDEPAQSWAETIGE